MSKKKKDIKKEDSQNHAKRKDWEIHHALMIDNYLRLFAERKRPPTQTELAKVCGLSRDTIAKHLEDMQLSDVMPEMKLRTQRVLHGLASRAEKGYAAEVKLWMQLVYGWTEKNAETDVLNKLIEAVSVTIVKAKR